MLLHDAFLCSSFAWLFLFFLLGRQLSRAATLVRNFEQMSIICTRAREYALIATQRTSLLGWDLPGEHRSIASSCKVHTLKVLLVKIFASETANQLLSIVQRFQSMTKRNATVAKKKKINNNPRTMPRIKAGAPNHRPICPSRKECQRDGLYVCRELFLLRSAFSCGCCASLLGNQQHPTDRWVRYFDGRTYTYGSARPATASSKRTAPFGEMGLGWTQAN